MKLLNRNTMPGSHSTLSCVRSGLSVPWYKILIVPKTSPKIWSLELKNKNPESVRSSINEF